MVDITPHAKVQDLIDQGAKASRKYERGGRESQIPLTESRKGCSNQLKSGPKWPGRRIRSFRCPITQEVMGDPVAAVDGHVYERAAIEQ